MSLMGVGCDRLKDRFFLFFFTKKTGRLWAFSSLSILLCRIFWYKMFGFFFFVCVCVDLAYSSPPLHIFSYRFWISSVHKHMHEYSFCLKKSLKSHTYKRRKFSSSLSDTQISVLQDVTSVKCYKDRYVGSLIRYLVYFHISRLLEA